MNQKALDKKVSKRLNEVLEGIKKELPVINSYHTGYFIFDIHVVHFNLENCKGWKFGIWVYEDMSYSIIGEHYECIDKFKPGRTFINEKTIEGFVNIVKIISSDLKLAFVATMNDLDLDMPPYGADIYTPEDKIGRGYQVCWDEKENKYYIDKSIKKEEFINNYYYTFYKNKRKTQCQKNNCIQELMNVSNELLTIKNMEVVGIEDGNWKTEMLRYPRFSILIDYDTSISDEEFLEMKNKIDNYLDKYNHFVEEMDCPEYAIEEYASNEHEKRLTEICRYIYSNIKQPSNDK